MTHISDPPRFSDPHAGGPGLLQNLFSRAEQDLPTTAELEGLAARLEPAFAAPPAGGTGVPTATPRLVWGLGLAGVVAAGAAAVWLLSGREAPSTGAAPRESAAVSTTVVAPVAPVAPVGEAPAAVPGVEALPAPTSGAVSSASATRASSATSQRSAQPSEAALLERARRALAADPARALALTRQHQQQFPNGILNQEREVIAIEALRRLGKGAEASDRAGSFEKQYPDSAHRRALESGAGK